MNAQWQRALFLVLACSVLQVRFIRSQSTTAAAQTPVRVYKSTDGVSAPSLLAPKFPVGAAADCRHPVSGTVELAAVVGPSGQPQNLQFVTPLGNHLDRYAVVMVAADRFQPATRNGSAVATGVKIAMTLQACDVAIANGQGKPTHELELRSQPQQTVSSYDNFPDEVIDGGNDQNLGIYRVAGDVSAPVPFSPPQPIVIGDGQGKAKFEGIVLISFIVDPQGLPLNLRVIRPLGLGLDEKALEAARNLRFAPAMRRHMQPVAVMITIEIHFRIYCDIRATGCIE